VKVVQRWAAVGILLLAFAIPARAQDRRHAYAGALFGVSTLSADGRSITTPPDARVSLYKPENGPALNGFAGVHFTRFLTVQANYVWDRNDVTLLSTFLSPSGGGFSEQSRGSSQHTLVADALLYFRGRGSGVRPYLSTGVGVVRFASAGGRRTVESGLPAPQGAISRSVDGGRFAIASARRSAAIRSVRG